MNDAKGRIEAFQIEYNRHRPHTSLGFMTPHEYALQLQLSKGQILIEENLST